MDLRRINFGIEIETVKRTRERVAQAIQSVVGGQVRHIGSPGSFDPWEVTDDHGRVWKVVSDGSLINVPIRLRAEVVLLAADGSYRVIRCNNVKQLAGTM